MLRRWRGPVHIPRTCGMGRVLKTLPPVSFPVFAIGIKPQKTLAPISSFSVLLPVSDASQQFRRASCRDCISFVAPAGEASRRQFLVCFRRPANSPPFPSTAILSLSVSPVVFLFPPRGVGQLEHRCCCDPLTLRDCCRSDSSSFSGDCSHSSGDLQSSLPLR